MKSKSFLIKDNVYNRQTLVYVGKSQRDFNVAFKKAFKDPAPETDFFTVEGVTGRTILLGSIVVVLLKQKDIHTAVHELFHATEFHFEVIGIKHSDESSEAWAYYLAFLVKQFIEITNP